MVSLDSFTKSLKVGNFGGEVTKEDGHGFLVPDPQGPQNQTCSESSQTSVPIRRKVESLKILQLQLEIIQERKDCIIRNQTEIRVGHSIKDLIPRNKKQDIINKIHHETR